MSLEIETSKPALSFSAQMSQLSEKRLQPGSLLGQRVWGSFPIDDGTHAKFYGLVVEFYRKKKQYKVQWDGFESATIVKTNRLHLA